MLNLAIPVLNNYEGLYKLIYSAENGSLVPDGYYVIDNGGKLEKSEYRFVGDRLKVITPVFNLGVAASWNIFIKSVPQMRIIMNDDIEFFPDSLENFVKGVDHTRFNWAESTQGVNSFSFFYLSDPIIEKVGLFDENISPRYAYFEDNDYAYRIRLTGDELNPIKCELKHEGSATSKHYTQQEIDEHHNKFRIAEANFQNKWGGAPDHENYLTPYNK